ncbi:hypothetical protein EJ04DRAFT_566349 [Polyplosphaeria fusca]|uniref:Uncharacterized protein n=1 Tax=Polyplosphaeria fusca TaxID=682080 RepID=A0A9P4QQU1_9PLEO|nr:hypothetical protein EJ04DRAFT_566349 [Polyplosphaeria fusca]
MCTGLSHMVVHGSFRILDSGKTSVRLKTNLLFFSQTEFIREYLIVGIETRRLGNDFSEVKLASQVLEKQQPVYFTSWPDNGVGFMSLSDIMAAGVWKKNKHGVYTLYVCLEKVTTEEVDLALDNDQTDPEPDILKALQTRSRTMDLPIHTGSPSPYSGVKVKKEKEIVSYKEQNARKAEAIKQASLLEKRKGDPLGSNPGTPGNHPDSNPSDESSDTELATLNIGPSIRPKPTTPPAQTIQEKTKNVKGGGETDWFSCSQS